MKAKPVGGRRSAVPLSLELLGVLEARRLEFERKFGRPPRRGEPLFFDPDAAQPLRLPLAARRAALATVLRLSGQPDHVVAEFVDSR
ncbi:MAG: hypothetical protein HYU60_01350 [Magnetospirillum sp.]|nr:hypothetical protein [Magnetospirillum sp.]